MNSIAYGGMCHYRALFQCKELLLYFGKYVYTHKKLMTKALQYQNINFCCFKKHDLPINEGKVYAVPQLTLLLLPLFFVLFLCISIGHWKRAHLAVVYCHPCVTTQKINYSKICFHFTCRSSIILLQDN